MANPTNENRKSRVDQIRERFDKDVDRFSNLETGQSATIDAPLVLDLIVQAAAAINPTASKILDVGCGAGSYTIRLLNVLPNLDVTLIDLSRPMLDKAEERIRACTTGTITSLRGDIRDIELGLEEFDIIFAAAVLHHLRSDTEWHSVFKKLYLALKPGGSFWVADLIQHSHAEVQGMMWERYGAYLTQLRDEAYRDHVFDYIAQEDTPRSLIYQIDLMRQVGFALVDILHKNGPFAAFYGVRPR